MDEKKSYPTPRGAAATKAKAKYNAKAYDVIRFTVKKGEGEHLTEIALSQGYKSRAEFITAAINEKIGYTLL